MCPGRGEKEWRRQHQLIMIGFCSKNFFFHEYWNSEFLTKIAKGRPNDNERQNILSQMSQKSWSTLHREMNYPWGKRLYTEFCLRKERSGIAWLVGVVWKLKGTSELPRQRPLPDNIHQIQDFHAPTGFEPGSPASDCPQTHALAHLTLPKFN